MFRSILLGLLLLVVQVGLYSLVYLLPESIGESWAGVLLFIYWPFIKTASYFVEGGGDNQFIDSFHTGAHAGIIAYSLIGTLFSWMIYKICHRKKQTP